MNNSASQFLKPICKLLSLLALVELLMPLPAKASGNWLKLADTAPDAVNFMILLSDGTVMAANNTAGSTYGRDWYKLAPDQYGHYVDGNWSRRASAQYTRLYFASQVLVDGRLFVAGGEYGTGGANAEIYDPLFDSWTAVYPPGALIGITANNGFIDAESVLLPGGKVLIHPVSPATNNATIIYDPYLNSWSASGITSSAQDESSWVKLPDGSILTVNADLQTSERFIPSLNQWILDANLPVSLWATLPGYYGEAGPAFLLPNGNAFFLGGSGHTCIYTPSGTTNVGSWTAGPDIPGGLVAADAPAAMMPNGKILCAVAPAPTEDGLGNPVFSGPTSFFEYDYSAGATGAFTQVGAPTGSSDNIASFLAAMLVLPDGSVLYSHVGNQLYVYAPDGSQLASGKPFITGITPNANGSFHLTGRGFNGISQGAAYGDDAQMDGNYPIVLVTDNNNGHADYGRTFNWSSTGVRTGNTPVSTDFTVSRGLLPQNYSLTVIGCGISSDPVSFTAPVWVDYNYLGSLQNGSYDNPYKTFAQGVSAVSVGGTIFFESAGHHAETFPTPSQKP
jgi:hypothetical protein